MSLGSVLQLHFTAIGLSVLFLVIRYVMQMANSTKANALPLKIPSHIFDFLILVSGGLLIHITGWMPFTAAGAWLTDKLLFVVAYFVFEFLTLQKFGKLGKTVSFILALLSLMMAAKLAMLKVALF